MCVFLFSFSRKRLDAFPSTEKSRPLPPRKSNNKNRNCHDKSKARGSQELAPRASRRALARCAVRPYAMRAEEREKKTERERANGLPRVYASALPVKIYGRRQGRATGQREWLSVREVASGSVVPWCAHVRALPRRAIERARRVDPVRHGVVVNESRLQVGKDRRRVPRRLYGRCAGRVPYARERVKPQGNRLCITQKKRSSLFTT